MDKNKTDENKTDENKTDDLKIHAQMQRIQNTLTRLSWANQLGETYSGDRELYKVFGYKKTLEFDDYWRMFKRGDIADTIISKVPKACWKKDDISIYDDEENKKTVFTEELSDIFTGFNVFNALLRADILMRVSEYSILLMGFNDVEKQAELKEEVQVSNTLELLYLQPYSFKNAKIKRFVTDTTDSRFGLPLTYQIKIGSQDSSEKSIESVEQKTVEVHYSRVLHFTENNLENDIYGTPALMSIYNRIEDIQKILGSSGEMFWRGAVPGMTATGKDGYTFDDASRTDLQTQLDEWEHKLRRFMTVKGVDIGTIEQQITSPADTLDSHLNIIAIVTGIPKRIFSGSERGELASTQDQNTYNRLISERRDDVCSYMFIRQFIDRLIEYSIISAPKKDTYEIKWAGLSAIGEKEKSEISLNKTKSIKEYVSAPGANMLLPENVFLRDVLGYSQDEIEDIINTTKDMIEEEEGEGEEDIDTDNE